MWLKTGKSDAAQGNIFNVYFSFFLFSLDKVFTMEPDFLAVMLSKFQGKWKNFATSAFGFQFFMRILEIRHIYIFLQFAFGADYRCLIRIVHVNFFHKLSSSVQDLILFLIP
jgi:hypothetical protein